MPSPFQGILSLLVEGGVCVCVNVTKHITVMPRLVHNIIQIHQIQRLCLISELKRAS